MWWWWYFAYVQTHALGFFKFRDDLGEIKIQESLNTDFVNSARETDEWN